MSRIMQALRNIHIDTEMTMLERAWKVATTRGEIQDADALQTHFNQFRHAYGNTESAFLAAENTNEEAAKERECRASAQAFADFIRRQLEANDVKYK